MCFICIFTLYNDVLTLQPRDTNPLVKSVYIYIRIKTNLEFVQTFKLVFKSRCFYNFLNTLKCKYMHVCPLRFFLPPCKEKGDFQKCRGRENCMLIVNFRCCLYHRKKEKWGYPCSFLSYSASNMACILPISPIYIELYKDCVIYQIHFISEIRLQHKKQHGYPYFSLSQSV